MSRCLVVNADDFGRSRGVSAGIIEAHLQGLVTTTTALMNLQGARDDVAQSARQAPDLGLGVHLNLTLGSPLSPPAAVPTLVTDRGVFWTPDELAARAIAIDAAQVATEWRAQIEAFLSLGAPLDHLDSHHHAALFSPAWWRIALDLAVDYGCGLRPPAPDDTDDDALFSRFPRAARRFALSEARQMGARRGVPMADRLVTRFYGPSATLPNLLAILEGAPEGTTELMCHPGRMDSIVASGSGYARERELELIALTSPAAHQVVRDRGLRLATYRTMTSPA